MANNNDIEKNVYQAIKERVGEVIDPDAMKKLVDLEIQRFFTATTRPGHYGEPESPVRVLIRNEVHNLATAKVKELLNESITQEKIINQISEYLCGEDVKPLVRGIVAGALDPIFRQIRGY